MRLRTLLIMLNVFFEAVVAFLLVTDYECNGTLANIMLPFAVQFFGSLVYRRYKGSSGTAQRCFLFFVRLPSFAASLLFVVLGVFLMLFSMMGAAFWISEQAAKTTFYAEKSPDGLFYCKADFYPVGAYGAGTGRCALHLVPTFCPVFQKQIYYDSAVYFEPEDFSDAENDSVESAEATAFFHWKDDRTIAVWDGTDSVEIKVTRRPALFFH